ncbi:iron-containing alcohol dehydrogenase [Cohnella lupini]|uniref:Alcohol dehydrogenase YqhD (Iron-dependent ADH family) n=1 Tax=Cohnella lupini TaxID=1294267 RepID=A0A3D9I4E8_9BACL|nr:iron-containing alcohol dehydrogenase [Cohnella lupini]RED56614.1 alcohol dehydrogenase YqhD (iron-dependent ADH family) [Cohnella lupini]
MNSFQIHNPTKLIFGKGCLSSIPSELSAYGTRVLLLYGGGSIIRNGLYYQVIDQLKELNASIVEFGGVEPNPRLTTVYRGIQLIKEYKLDIILAVGGGSVIDCAKAIAAGSLYEGDVWDIVIGKVTPVTALPIGTVLTLAATGSEMNGNSVITNWEKNCKRYFSSIHVYPKFSILDPEWTFSVPRDQTVYGIVDIMSHVFEQYFHAAESAPLQERIGEAILRTVMETAPMLVNDLNNYDYRATMLLNGTHALNGLLAMGERTDWATHEIEQAVSAIYDIPHGGGLAILFPNWMEHVATTKPEKIAQLGVRVFNLAKEGKSDTQLAGETIARLRTFWTSIGAPASLSDYDIDDKEIDLMVESAMAAPTIGSYVPLMADDVRAILRKSL